MAPKKKKVAGLIKLQIQAGQANPAPPVGPALGHAGRLQQQLGRRRGLGDEGERTVLEHRDLDRYDLAALRLGGRVVGLAELHDVDAVLAERRADRRGRVGGASLDLQLDDRGKLLLGRHGYLFF